MMTAKGCQTINKTSSDQIHISHWWLQYTTSQSHFNLDFLFFRFKKERKKRNNDGKNSSSTAAAVETSATTVTSIANSISFGWKVYPFLLFYFYFIFYIFCLENERNQLASESVVCSFLFFLYFCFIPIRISSLFYRRENLWAYACMQSICTAFNLRIYYLIWVLSRAFIKKFISSREKFPTATRQRFGTRSIWRSCLPLLHFRVQTYTHTHSLSLSHIYMYIFTRNIFNETFNARLGIYVFLYGWSLLSPLFREW